MKRQEKKYLFPAAVLLLWMGIFAFANGSCQSFWADEIASVGFIRTGLSLAEVLDTYLRVENNLPLYPLILYVVYRIMPYGEKFLLIPSILFCMAGIVLLALSADRLKGKRMAFLSLCLGTSSGALLWQAAWEIRCYALAFLLSALVLYTYIDKSLNPDKKRMVRYGAAVALFFWTHWFACILLAFYGFVDLIRVILHRISWKQLLCYIPGCMLYFPWLIASFYYKSGGLEDYWSEVPQWKDTLWTILFYVDGHRALWYLFLLTAAAVMVCAVRCMKKPGGDERDKTLLLALGVLAVGWVIGIVYVFSRYVYPQGGLYVVRYFTVVQPHILLITALGLDALLQAADRCGTSEGFRKLSLLQRPLIRKAAAWTVRAGVIAVLFISFATCYRNQYIAIRKPFEPYREAVDDLVKEGGIWEEDALFIGSNRFCMLDGLVHYYFEKRGYKPPCNIVDSIVHSRQESRFYPNYTQLSRKELLSYDRIYCVRIHMDVSEELQTLLEKYYTLTQSKDVNGIEIWERRK